MMSIFSVQTGSLVGTVHRYVKQPRQSWAYPIKQKSQTGTDNTKSALTLEKFTKPLTRKFSHDTICRKAPFVGVELQKPSATLTIMGKVHRQRQE
ncbi:Hypothetical protein DIP0592 [Corynebacterium diphtheriae]|uniref:Uncharacterized protein n=1 Tax=Corynebacterium diphtheriae (strain ATCC 700971 / NCTC 13129 / Biotype gravis) TaxID=257309 RepID=Q6NJ23_CORDI|nr:Hypothetical protein DIP0592 [Corynebacterium diphtheriae]